MRKKILEYIKRNLPGVIHFVILEILGNLLWTWISKGFSFTLVREVGYLVIFIAVIFAVAWYLPKLSLRQYSFGFPISTKVIIPQITNDNVRWEDRGNDHNGYMRVVGPLCPIDSTQLIMKTGDKEEREVQDIQRVYDSSWKLYCLKCKHEYVFGRDGKSIGDARKDAGILLEQARNTLRRHQEI